MLVTGLEEFPYMKSRDFFNFWNLNASDDAKDCKGKTFKR